ncbi:MAG: Maf family protein [Rubellimicrobium sp.]|nr:Maf family protein [Rubellimicrobium sp.]
MTAPIILASSSSIRAALLRQAQVPFDVSVPRIDEPAIRAALSVDGASPRDMADALAEMKASRVSQRHPGRLVLGCDQILALGPRVFSKAESLPELRAQLCDLRGQTHSLFSAVVACEDGRPLWRQVREARLTMRDLSDDWLDAYLDRNGSALLDSVGGYRIEEEGIRLFSRIEGDYFTILGLPLLDLLNWLTIRGTLTT